MFPSWIYFMGRYVCASVQFSRSVVSDSLGPHEAQPARPSCPSPTPRVHPNPCQLSQWCHPTISSSLIPFFSCLKLSQHQGLFQWVRSSHQVGKGLELLFQPQSFQWIFKVNFLKDWLVWSPCCPWDSQDFSSTTIRKHQFFGTRPSLFYYMLWKSIVDIELLSIT